MNPKRMSRRRFVASCAAMATGLVAAACAPKVVEKVVTKEVPVEVTKIVKEVVKETVVVEGTPQVVEKEVTRIVKETVVVEKAPPTEEVIEITVGMSEHANQPIIPDAPAHLAITEETGVKLNLVVPADYEVKQQLWLATNDVPDLMEAGVADIQDFVDQGVLLPLMPLINEHAPNLKRWVDTNWEVYKKLTVGGELYHTPTLDYNMKIFASMPMIRRDILDELGLETPTSFEELFEVLKACKKAYPDSLVWTCRIGTTRLLTVVAYAMGSGFGRAWTDNRMYFDKDVDGGTWRFGPIHPEFKYVLDYFARAYAEGILDPDFASTESDQWHEKNSSNQGLFSYENMVFCSRWNVALREANPDAKWDVLYTLEGEKGARNTNYVGEHLRGGWVIGANTKYPERVIKLLDWMITPQGLDVTNWGVEGVHYRYVKGSRPETIEDYTDTGVSKAMDPTQKELLPEVYEEHAGAAIPYMSFGSAVGVTLLDFMVFADFAPSYLWDPPGGEAEAWYEVTGSDPGLHMEAFAPPFTKEEGERIKEAVIKTNAILDPAYDKVIIGQMSLAEYDQVVEQARADAEELEGIYNGAEAKLK